MIEPKPKWAQCENCGAYIIGHPAESYQNDEVFCSLECNKEYLDDYEPEYEGEL